jgi:hypothetical protein
MSLSFHPDLLWTDATSPPRDVHRVCSWCGGPIAPTADVLQLRYTRQELRLHGRCFAWLVAHEALLLPATTPPRE